MGGEFVEATARGRALEQDPRSVSWGVVPRAKVLVPAVVAMVGLVVAVVMVKAMVKAMAVGMG